MGFGWRRAVWLHARFTILLVGIGGLVLLIGSAPTRNLGGSSGIRAMWLACGLTVLASAVAALPVTLAAIRPRKEQLVTVLMGSMALRLALVVVLAVAAVLAGSVERKPFLLWIAFSYLALLPLDTWYALQFPKQFKTDS